MLVELLLADGAGNDGEVVMLVEPIIKQQLEQPLKDHAVAVAGQHRQQTDLAYLAARRQVTVDVAELFVE